MSTVIPAINILLADDHRIITDGLCTLLQAEPFVKKIFTVHNGQAAVDIALHTEIDCVIMDLNMPVLNGLDATISIKKNKPSIKIIVVSMMSDAAIVNKLLKAGADAFLNKDTGKEELLKAIAAVMNHDKYISAGISLDLFTHLSGNAHKNGQGKHLTIREIEIIKLIADGLTNHEIATRLFISTLTVDTHRKNILSKLQLKNTASLVKYAAEQKLL